MFYHILLDSFEEMAPIIYTPTVGWACLNYHKLFRRPRGMYFSKLGALIYQSRSVLLLQQAAMGCCCRNPDEQSTSRQIPSAKPCCFPE